MAESPEDGGGSWWGGWLQSAKEMSTAALDMVKKDLAEFGCTMQKDAGHAVAVTSSTVKDSLKAENTSAARDKVTKGLNALLEGISKALTVPPDDEGQIPITRSSAAGVYDRAKARLHAVQIDPETYLQPPSGPPETFSMWCSGFDLESVKGEISELLVSKVEVRGLYTKLVPAQLSHADFWQRYFYKVHQIQIDQARKEALMMRAEQARADDSINWDDDWSGDEQEDQGSDWESLPRPGERASATPAARDPGRKDVPASMPKDTSLGEEPSMPLASLESCRLSPVQETQTDNSMAVTMDSKQNFSYVGPADNSSLAVAAHSCIQQETVDKPIVPPSCRETAVQDPGVSFTVGVESCQRQSPDEPVSHYAVTGSDWCEPDPAETRAVGWGEGEEPASSCASHQDHLPQSTSVSQQAEVHSMVSLVASQEASHESSADCQPALSAEPLSQVCLPDAASTVHSQTQEEPRPCAPVVSSFNLSVQDTISVTVAGGRDIKTTIKGDLVVVGSEHGSPVSTTSDPKEASADEDWEQDLDIELTEEDMKAAEELAKKMGENIDLEDDWESWE